MKPGESTAPTPNLRPTIALLSWLTLAYLASFVGYLGSNNGLWFWYITQNRPAWDFPIWAYTPGWLIASGLIGFAGWLVSNAPTGPERSAAVMLFGSQLSLAALWPWIFFTWQKPAAGLGEIAVLLALTVVMTTVFWRLIPRAGKCMILPTVWIAYLTVLDFAVWRLNR